MQNTKYFTPLLAVILVSTALTIATLVGNNWQQVSRKVNDESSDDFSAHNEVGVPSASTQSDESLSENENLTHGTLAVPSEHISIQAVNQLDGKNCCKEACMIRPLMATSAHSCPEKYLVFSPFGQINNSIRQLIAMLILGAVTNRTVLLTNGFGLEWNRRINATAPCTRLVNDSQLDEIIAANGRPMRTVSWDYSLDSFKDYRGFPIERFMLDERHFKSYANNTVPLLRCVAQSWPIYSDDLVVWVPNPFFSGIPKALYMESLKTITATDDQEQLTLDFIAKTFNNRPFVGIHLRDFEGSGAQVTSEHFSGPLLAHFLPEALAQLEMDWAYVSGVIRSHGFDPDTVDVLLATDNQRPGLTDALLLHKNVRRLNAEAVPAQFLGAVDSNLLVKSALFIGSPISSLSFHVALYREIQGHNKSTNVLAAYQELGLINHLFMDPGHVLA